MKRSVHVCLIIVIIAAGVAGGVIFVKTRPEAKRKRQPRMTPVVQCQPLKASAQQVRLDVMGTVLAAQSIELKVQVGGEIIKTDTNWIEGGRLAKGTPVVTLEASDYQIVSKQAKADLAQVQSELALERGRQDVAKREWELLGGKGDRRDRELALRVPQLAAAQARVDAAKLRIEQAELALSRTKVRAPFNALVVSRRMNRGDIATPQISLGTVVDTDAFHVRVSIPIDQLKWIELPNERQDGSRATILIPDGTVREGHVIRLLADLEPTGRMARVLVEVAHPLDGQRPMLLGSYVQVQIACRTIPDAYRISRVYYREGGQVWMMQPDKTLRIVAVAPIWSDRSTVIVRFDADPKEQLIVSDLPAAIEGMDLRVSGEPGLKSDKPKRGKRD